MIQIKNITKKYGKTTILDKVSLEINQNKLIALIGPNGAGKSTLLSIATRLLEFDDGSIIIDGKDIYEYDNSILAKKISVLRQANEINVKLTVRDLVSFGRFPYTKGDLNQEDNLMIDKALDYLHLRDIQQKYIDQLSGGQKQRVFIAMVVAQDSEYIFLDEPLNNLDMKHASSIMKILRELVDSLNKTVVVVLHDINFASIYADEIIAFKNGVVCANGSNGEVINKELLEILYETDISIHKLNNKKVCYYY